MITQPMDVLYKYPVRKTGKQKTAFITAVCAYVQGLRYSASVERGNSERSDKLNVNMPYGARNIVFGNPEKAKYLITAHYDTGNWSPLTALVMPCKILLQMLYVFLMLLLIFGLSVGVGFIAALLAGNADLAIPISAVALAVAFAFNFTGPARWHPHNSASSGMVALLEIAASVPENLRDRVCFVLLDKSSEGFIGADCYYNRHTIVQTQTVIHLDCLGDGDEIILFPSKGMRKDQKQMQSLSKICGRWGKKSILLQKKGLAVYPSDHSSFPCSLCVAAFHRSKIIGPYLCHFRTKQNRVLDETNINILRAALITLIGMAEK